MHTLLLLAKLSVQSVWSIDRGWHLNAVMYWNTWLLLYALSQDLISASMCDFNQWWPVYQSQNRYQLVVLQVLHVVEMKRSMTLRFYMLRIMPVGLFMALTLHFGNTVYLYLTVSFVQMLKVMCI